MAFKIWKVGVGGMSYRVYHLCRRCNFINREIWIEAWSVLPRIDKKWLKKVNRSSNCCIPYLKWSFQFPLPLLFYLKLNARERVGGKNMLWAGKGRKFVGTM